MPFSMAGMYCFGTEPPKISSTNAKPASRSWGSMRILQSPNWPWPPVCFLCRPWTSALAVMVSRYGILGCLSRTSTPYRLFMRSTVTSTWSWPEPDTSSSLVCGSRWKVNMGSSSRSRARALLIFSSSPRLLGSTAKLMAGSGYLSWGSRAGLALSARVCPDWVAFSLATATMSPARASEMGAGVLPCIT